MRKHDVEILKLKLKVKLIQRDKIALRLSNIIEEVKDVDSKLFDKNNEITELENLIKETELCTVRIA